MAQNPEKKRKCPKCSKTFKTGYDLTNHIVRHDPNAKVKCQVCGLIYKNRLALSSHMWHIHRTRELPRCDTCNRVFSTVQNLRVHTDTVHSTRERLRLPCTFPGCEKTFLHKHHVARHVRTNHAENPVRFPCTLCRKEFKTRVELEGHILTHTTEKPHTCTTCGRRFAHKSHMRSHEVTHLEKATRHREKCSICCRTFLPRRIVLRIKLNGSRGSETCRG
ncbi:gastrula zinc finger protein XlCGF8.2DB-like isoform X2 [Folsomia candida]|uniref:gastrula zinc finger protein XlCGF8.2DB-like isoform X2 n=1 Tax=Folsomia candida TaxID=158441 RepID=UPI001604AE58|nr:gastrula zinc finger protein XlCGF8.2DB-like isoform X2 [Folsomia candida]